MAEPMTPEGPLADYLEEMNQQLYGRSRIKSIENDECVACGGVAVAFKDEVGQQEYTQSGMCQTCQEENFKEEDGDDT